MLIPVRCSVVLAIAVAAVTALSCSIDATDGAGPSAGGSGALGDTCTCANGASDCDNATGRCNAGLRCVRNPSGSRSACTRACPCPLTFVCQAAGAVGGALLCFK